MIIDQEIAVSKEDSAEDFGRNSIDSLERKLQEKNAIITKKESKIKNLQNIIRCYEEKLRLSKVKKFSYSSEQAEFIQIDFFDYQDEEISKEGAKCDESDTSADEVKKTKSVGRKIDTSKLTREVVFHDLSDSEKCCTHCKGELHKIGEDVSEKIEVVPAVLKVIEHRRAKYACRKCDTVKSVPKPQSLIPKCMAGNSLIIEVILGKFQRHIPYYRQSQILKSAKIDIPDTTLGSWVLNAFDALAPISDALWEQLCKTHVLQVDETPVKILSENKKGYMWVYHSCDQDNRFVLYEYNTSRSSKVVNERLKNFSGILQNDGYSGYNHQRAREVVSNVGCFAHCRRKFVDVIKASAGKAKKAQEAIAFIGKLYKIERRAKKLTHDARYIYRQENAKPILDEFHRWLKDTLPKTPPESQLGKAVKYALNQWIYLYEYVNHGEVEIDNNLVENKIRPFAIGRKNWMFVGNQRGADASALFYSLIESCKLNDIEPRAYFVKLFEMAASLRRGEISGQELLPQNIKSSL